MPHRSPTTVGRVILSALLVPAGVAHAQDSAPCPDGVVSAVVIENHSVFDPASIPEDGRLSWAYRLANRIHMRTRAEFIERGLLFEEGGCPAPGDLEESARILREYQFLARADVFVVPQANGERQIVVDTRDEWTTKPSLSLRFDDGVRFEGIAIVEENLFGRGIAVGAYRIDRDALRETGGALEIPSFADTRADALVQVSRNRVGGRYAQELVVPFLAERPGSAFRQRVQRRRDFFEYVLPEDAGGSHVVLPMVEERMELSAARRIGDGDRLYVAGVGLSYERIGIDDPAEAEVVIGSDFSKREPADPALANELHLQATSRRAVRVNALGGFRRLEFDAREGLDAVTGVQDVPVGHRILVVVGRSVGNAGSRPGDLLARARYLFGHSGTHTVSQLHLRGEARREDAAPGTSAALRDGLLEAHGLLYFVPRGGALQNVLLRGAIQSGWRTTAPFQLTLGGPDGVRGFRDTHLPGGRRGIVSVEARLRSPNPLPDLVDLGLTAFTDVGTIWRGDVPFGVDSGWRAAVGGGIRVAFPAGSSAIIRADLAFPVGPGASHMSPVFRISAHEWVGLLDPFQNPLMERSRRSGMDGEYGGVARDRREW